MERSKIHHTGHKRLIVTYVNNESGFVTVKRCLLRIYCLETETLQQLFKSLNSTALERDVMPFGIVL